ncbi:MAG: citrate lyase holo-[acyl-carrier protein] synthase [Candidatus Limivicinus sp.]|jgi:holo-ACP synthase/triphosphoribosyl-dephospho-CoA synthase
MEVNLQQMLEARENRASRQFSAVKQFGLPIVSFTMNIPGPVKDSPLIRRAFREGCRVLEYRLPENSLKHREIVSARTGNEALYAVSMDALELKRLTTVIEDSHGLGRLFDMDVIDTRFEKLERSRVNGAGRNCIVCGAPGADCASRRLHSVEELQQAARGIMCEYFRRTDAEIIASHAVQSLIDEVCTTPKPGLVDCSNCGSHSDMDIFSFSAGASALFPYFEKCVCTGQQTAEASPEKCFALLRAEGLNAEQRMFEFTGGENTHKGAVFSLGIMCGAAGRVWRPEGGCCEEDLFAQAAALADTAARKDLASPFTDSNGLRLYASLGIKGIRGEAAAGFPSVKNTGLPAFREYLSKGMGKNYAGVLTLLQLAACVADTNMLHRGGPEGAAAGRERAKALVADGRIPKADEVRKLDEWFIENNLSPGGCADLLAIVYFVEHLTEENKKT